MDYAEYRRFDAVGLAELVRSGEIAPRELLETAIQRAEQVNGRLNAIVRPMFDTARERASQQLTGALAGVPFLIKDLHQDYAGVRTGSGSRSTRNTKAPRHSTSVERWLDAGLVIFGRTNTPEFGAKGITEPEANGPARNPWNTAHTPGGSSGGAAAAVAAGVVPVAGASDGGGSIRIPAACCGLFGLKPGRGLVSAGPDAAEHMHGGATDGVISRSVRDTAVMLDALTARPDTGGPYLAARPEQPYAECARRDPGRLRIGFTTRSPLGYPVSPHAVTAVKDAAALLAGLGHDVEEAEPDIDGRQLSRDFLSVWFVQLAHTVQAAQRAFGAAAEDFELDTRLVAAIGRETKATEYVEILARWNDYNRALADFHDRYDVLLTPALAHPPARIGELDTPAPLRKAIAVLLRVGLAGKLGRTKPVTEVVLKNLEKVPYTQLANITGRPAMSVPLHQTPEDLPLGVQFVGALGAEPTLLSLATQLESERPWAHLEPPL
ncbi:amidase [Saccharopolyspora kobensis]|uniref:Amidase n=1 Tax=Saccharopolyspora kobensis TaxID=146035 RepID=A0A1H5XGY1_9PSEU|nr:amidase [Saccharopolyspora kobensis]SEG10883.1 amidase [Saccharopolyspora kobensis]SFE42969.1 amidase [Saccharopolyspora kobensis]